MDQATKIKIAKIQEAMLNLNQAKKLVREALGESCATQITVSQINDLIEDLDADILCLTEGVVL